MPAHPVSRIIARRCLPLVCAWLAAAPASAADPVVGLSASPAPPLADAPLVPPGTREIKAGEDAAERITLPVHIAGTGPFPFMVDTGSQRSIVAQDIARRLALPPREPVTVISLSGRSQVDTVAVPHLRYGREEVHGLDALVIDRGDLGGAGLIGLDSLKGKRVHFDFRGRRVEVSDSAGRRPRLAEDRDAIVVRARNRLGQLVLMDSRIGGLNVNVVLDTGAQVSIGNMALFHRLRAARLVIPPVPVTLVSVTGQEVSALYSAVDRVTVGAVTLDNVPMVFVDAAPFEELDLDKRPAMLLGMGMLRMFDAIAIDFGRRRVDFVLPRSEQQRKGERLAGVAPARLAMP